MTSVAVTMGDDDGRRERRGPRQSLKYQIRGILGANCDGSFATQRKREGVLLKFFADLKSAGFMLRKVRNLKPKHIEHQVESWKCAGLTPGTMKNNMAAVRWLAGKIGKASIVASNDDLGIERRSYMGEDKAWRDDGGEALLVAVQEKSSRLWLQMRLMREFGLRFKEAATLRPHQDDQGDTLCVIHGTKGGRPRVVPIRTQSQRQGLDDAKALASRGGSMIQEGMTFKEWRNKAEAVCQGVGLSKVTRSNFHALRHRYAQERYRELTGFEAPCRMSAEERWAATAEIVMRDKEARVIIAEELGHGRTAVCKIYLGGPL